MKKIVSLFLLTALLLCACGKKPEETVPPTTETVAPVTETVPETEPAETASTVKYRHPLTGEPLAEPFTGRPVTITINNLVDAMPQHGISNADFLYEVETEGGITRCLAVLTDLEPIEKLGPVRSDRTYFNNITLSYDGIIAHCGASSYAEIPSYDATGTKIENWQHIDAMSSEGFYRDKDRLKSGYATEHTLFTTGENLLKAIDKAGYPMSYDTSPAYGLAFDEDAKVQGEPANTVEIAFRGTKKTTMTYDAGSGLYQAAQYGKDWIDANGEEKPISFRNVLVLKAKQFNPDNYHSMYDLQGTGDGYLAMGGQIVPIKWSHEDVYGPFHYTFEDGKPVTLGVGKTYAAVVASSGKVTNS